MRRVLFLLMLLALSMAPIASRADLIKQSTTYTRTVLMTSSTDHITGATGLTLTITQSKAGAAYASISPTVTELGTGIYALAMTAGMDDTLGGRDLHITSTGADPTDAHDQIVAFDPADSAALGLTAVPISLAQVLSTSPTAGTVGESLLYADRLASRRNTAQAGTSTTITLDAGASSTDNLYQQFEITTLSGTGAGQYRTILSYVGSTKVATISSGGVGLPWSVTPDATTVFLLYPRPVANVGLWGGALANALIAGRVDANTQATAATLTYNRTGTTTGNITGNLSGSAGSIAGVTFPANFSLANFDAQGRVLLQPTQTGVTIPTVTDLTNVANIATAVMGANVDGSLTMKQCTYLCTAVISGKFLVTQNPTAHTRTVVYYRQDGTTTLATQVTTYTDASLTLPVSRATTFGSLP